MNATMATIVPVPLGARRRKERGYNQATEIAKVLGGIWPLNVNESVIQRVRETRSQTELEPHQRERNVHVAFRARNPEVVNAFHDAAVRAGGTDNGPPGLRPHYHPDYYGAFVFDPDGHNIEAMCRTSETAQ